MATITIEGTDYIYDQAIIGSDALADILTGTDDLVRYYINGLALNDNLTGAASDDVIVGGFGSDTLKGRGGDDTLIGDALTADGRIVGDLDLAGTSQGSVNPPGDNANWKAWENYENHLKDFFAHLDPTISYRHNGVVVTADELASAWADYNANLTLDDVHVITGQKIHNTNGNDTANHDITDNLALWASLSDSDPHQTDAAAFLDFGSVQAVPHGTPVPIIDTAVYSGPSDNYTLSFGPDGVTVHDNVGHDGTDTLIGIEQIKFTDITLATDWFRNAASVPAVQFSDLTDMYIAYFDRAPDAIGLCYWASRLADGMSLQQIARSFFVQPETLAAYPAGQSTEAFITQVYQNMLGRDPDAPGLQYWARDLDSGYIGRDYFMLAVIYGARAPTGSPADAEHLANKNAVGKDFAVHAGLSDVGWARSVMQDVDGSAASVAAAHQMTEHFSATASTAAGAHLVVELVGVAS